MVRLLVISFKSFFSSFDRSILSDDQKKANINYTFNIITKFKSLGVRIVILYNGDPQDVMNFFNESILANDRYIPKNDIIQVENTFEKKYQATESCIKNHLKVAATENTIDSNNAAEIIIIDANYDYLEYFKQQCPAQFQARLLFASYGYTKALEFKYKMAQSEMTAQIIGCVYTELKRIPANKNKDMKKSQSLLAPQSSLAPRIIPDVGSEVLFTSHAEGSTNTKKETIVSVENTVINIEFLEQLKASLYTYRTSALALYAEHLKKNQVAIREKWERSTYYNLITINSAEEMQSELRIYEQKIDIEIQRILTIVEINQSSLTDLLNIFTTLNIQAKKSIQGLSEHERKRLIQNHGTDNEEILPYLIELTQCYDHCVELHRTNARKQIMQVTHETQNHINALENDQKFLAHTHEMHRVKLKIDIIIKFTEILQMQDQTLNPDQLRQFSKDALTTKIGIELVDDYLQALTECPKPEYIAKEKDIQDAYESHKSKHIYKAVASSQSPGEKFVKLSFTENLTQKEIIEILIVVAIQQEMASFYKDLVRSYFNSRVCLTWLTKIEAEYHVKLNKLIEANTQLQQQITEKCASLDRETKAKVREVQTANLQCSTIFANPRASSKLGSRSGSSIGVPKSGATKRTSISLTSTHDQPLFSACKQGRLQQFQSELGKIPSSELKNAINTMVNLSKKTLLDVACQNGRGTIVEKLILYGADVTLAPSGFTPIFYAVETIDQDLKEAPNYCIVQQLLSAGAVINSTTVDEKLNTPLHKAAKISLGRSITHIIKHGMVNCPGSIDIHYKNNSGHTALYAAFVENSNTKNLTPVIEQFYAQGIGLSKEEIHALNKDYKPGMEEAIHCYHLEINKRLKIFQAAKLNFETSRLGSARMPSHGSQLRQRANTSSFFNVFALKKLSEKKHQFKSVLLMSFYENKVKPLADDKLHTLNQCDEAEGLAPIHVVCLSDENNTETLAYLLRSKVDVNLISGVKKVDTESGPVKNKENEKDKIRLGLTALHYACESGREDLVVELLKVKGIKILKDDNGMTPLHAAVIKGHAGIVRILLGHLCPKQHSTHNQTSYDYITLSQKYYIDTDTISQTAFTKALILGQKDVLNAFAEFGFVISDEDIKICLAELDKIKPDRAMQTLDGICAHLNEAYNIFGNSVIHSPGRPSQVVLNK